MPAPSEIPIVGHYHCEGGNYRGEVVIRDMGNNFAIHWLIGGTIHIGVGLRSGNVLSVGVGIPVTSVVAYEIQSGESQSGPSLYGRYSGFPAGGNVFEEILRFSHPLRTWEVGDELLAKWSRDPFWYPAVVRERRGETYSVRYADGDEEWVSPSRLMPDLLTVGDMVYHTQGLFHRDDTGLPVGASVDPTTIDQERMATPCRIIGREGDSIKLQWDDGAMIRSNINHVRTLAPRDG